MARLKHCLGFCQVGCMTKSPVEFKDSTMIGGILQILNIHYGSPFNEYMLLWCMMVSMTYSMIEEIKGKGCPVLISWMALFTVNSAHLHYSEI